MRQLLVLLAVMYSLTVGVFWVAATNTTILYPSSDSYSWESVPEANNGGSNNFAITSFATNPKNMRGWIAFPLQEIPNDIWLIDAKLRLRIWHKTTAAEGGDTTARIYGAYRLTQPWDEYTVNWVNQPNYSEEHHSTSAVPPGQGGWEGPPLYMDWDITAIVRDWLSGTPNYGLLIRDIQENAPVEYSTQFFQHSEKVPDASYYPRLIITSVGPQAVGILAAALIAEGLFITFLWRRKRSR